MSEKQRHGTRMWVWFGAALLSWAALAGCGGRGEEAPSERHSTADQSEAVVPHRVRPERLPAEPEQPEPDDALHKAAPEDLYVVLDPDRHDAGNFVVVRSRAATPNLDRFAVVVEADRRLGGSAFVAVAPAPNAPGSLEDAWRPPFPLPSGCAVVAEAGAHPDGWPRRLRWRDGSEGVLVPAGTFVFGHDTADGSQLAVTVELDAFYIDRTEVTLRQFALFRQARREARDPLPPEPLNSGAPPDHPALGVPFRWALAYARWLGKDLPTECEWEKAARGSDGLPCPWGAGRPLWTAPRTPATISAVGAFHDDRSPYGVFDLAGNAREWCRDWFAPDAHRQIIQRGPQARNWSGPRTPDSRFRRVVKGNAQDWRSWHREGVPQDAVQPTLGFRCVWRPPNSPR
ncbi:MAG: hypothetical protein D6725_08695 [Planctomycetota bacterium]|nr:MAG: hypothetical protein D6725_08695 [Planctomycetota bacterium]